MYAISMNKILLVDFHFHRSNPLPGVDCVTTQEGGAKYDPSTDGRHCGWSGPEASRCAEAGDSASFQCQG